MSGSCQLQFVLAVMELSELCASLDVGAAVTDLLRSWSITRLATLSDLSVEELLSMLQRLAGRDCTEEEVQEFCLLVSAAESWARSAWASSTARQSVAWAAVAMKLARYHRFSPLLGLPVESLPARPAKKQRLSAAKSTSWMPGGCSKDLCLPYSGEQRQDAETRERSRWVRALSALLL